MIAPRKTPALALVAALLCSQGGPALAGEIGRAVEGTAAGAPAAEIPALPRPLPALDAAGAPLAGAVSQDPLAQASSLADAAARPRAAAVLAVAAAVSAASAASAVSAAPAASAARDGSTLERASALRARGDSRGGWFAALGRFFDRSNASASPIDDSPAPETLGALSPSQVPVLLVAPGRAPERATLADAPRLLAAHGLTGAFDAEGHVRLVVGDGAAGEGRLGEAQLGELSRLLRSYGLKPDVERSRVERVLLDTAGRREGPAAGRSSLAQRLARVAIGAAAGAAAYAAFGAEYPLAAAMVAGLAAFADRLAVESVYAARTFAAALRESRRPTWFEVSGGLVGKVLPGVINAVGLWYFYNKVAPHPVGAAVAIGLSLAVEVFHGVWADTWNNLQSKLGAYRGLSYQGLFNFFYGQAIGVSYRLVAWLTLAGVAAPWTGAYWAPMIVMSVIGTFISTLGYRGLNGLYQKGAITRRGRSLRQYARDIFLMITGPLFGSGYVALTFAAFAIQQSFDLYFYFKDKRTATKPILYVADPVVAASPEFDKAFVHPVDPLHEAKQTLASNQFAKPLVSAYRWLKAKLGGK